MAGLTPDTRAALQPKAYKSPEDLGRAYLDLESKIGQRGVTPPGKDAGAEDLARYHAELRAIDPGLAPPETVEGYDLSGFKAPENIGYSEEVQGQVVGAMHKLGLTNAQVTGILQVYGEAQSARFAAERTARDTAFEAATTALKGEWGSAFDSKIALADRVLVRAAGKDLDAAKALKLEGGGFLLDNKVMAKIFAAVGEAWAEDGDLPGGAGGDFALTPGDAKAEIAKLKADEDFKKVFLDGNHPEHAAAVTRMQSLQAMAAATG